VALPAIKSHTKGKRIVLLFGIITIVQANFEDAFLQTCHRHFISKADTWTRGTYRGQDNTSMLNAVVAVDT